MGLRAAFVVVVGVGCAGPAPRPPPVTPIAVPVARADSDGDGIADLDDKCPYEAEDRDGFEDGDGCPEPDNDYDRIVDEKDQCPNEPETYNGFQDDDGCPDMQKVVISTSNPPAVERIGFDKGSSSPVASAQPILEAVVKVLAAHPEIELVQLEGHAQASEPKSVQLAQARADAVRAQLMKKGIDAKRLRAKGFGAYCSVPNDDQRRVEFKVVVVSGKPTATALGCDAATAAGVVSDPIP